MSKKPKPKIEKRVATAISRIADEDKIGLLKAAIKAANGYTVTEVTRRYSPKVEVGGDFKNPTFVETERVEREKHIPPNAKIAELLLLSCFPDLVRSRLEIEHKHKADTGQQTSPQAIREFAGKLLEFAEEQERTRKIIDSTVVQETENEQANRSLTPDSEVSGSRSCDATGTQFQAGGPGGNISGGSQEGSRAP